MEAVNSEPQVLEGEMNSPVEAPTAKEILQKSMYDILQMFDDPTREGLKETPRRWAKAMQELLNGHTFNMTTFDAEGYSQMVVQEDISFFTFCEHHVLPFFGHAIIGYIPNKKMVGLSKLARTVTHFSRRLQVQERMTEQIAAFLQEELEPVGVGVILRARHLCQEMRGIEKVGAHTTTSCLKGEFLAPGVREEFMRLSEKHRGG